MYYIMSVIYRQHKGGDLMQRTGNQNKIVIYLPDDILCLVDKKRGQVPRSTYIKSLLAENTGYYSLNVEKLQQDTTV